MWDKRLAAQARAYANGVLTVVDKSGYPISIRCSPVLDDDDRMIAFPELPSIMAGCTGPAGMLLHRHDTHLEGLHQMLIRGELVARDEVARLVPSEFVTANGSHSTDRMPHADAPLQLLRFMLLGRRRAGEYLAKHTGPWSVRFDELGDIAAGHDERNEVRPGRRCVPAD